ncbi:hypothetical protein JIG36_03760 [Actinoplanes sp. LDG1-06]|uniref:Uncharacterized protein n=1 Tax=Paractinoplanes ovalisporus TaxID=2810368 RepID=A0ABS2A488_9ACTN|nr:hypothetical protein [Actinoplanes ovalisporus]MBM2614670.1 hypothetical protein [Actinoplanes ovalisporus]
MAAGAALLTGTTGAILLLLDDDTATARLDGAAIPVGPWSSEPSPTPS